MYCVQYVSLLYVSIWYSRLLYFSNLNQALQIWFRDWGEIASSFGYASRSVSTQQFPVRIPASGVNMPKFEILLVSKCFKGISWWIKKLSWSNSGLLSIRGFSYRTSALATQLWESRTRAMPVYFLNISREQASNPVILMWNAHWYSHFRTIRAYVAEGEYDGSRIAGLLSCCPSIFS